MKYFKKNLVSIGIPTYNRYELLEACLKSLISQNYENIEIIISDNSEQDSLPDSLKHIIFKDSRIKYFKQAYNIGEIKNTYFIKSKFKGEYACVIHDDDIIPKNYISKLLLKLKNSNSCVLAGFATDRYFNGRFWYSYENIDTIGFNQLTRVTFFIKRIFCSGGMLEYFWNGLYKVSAHPSNFKIERTGSIIFFIFLMSIKGGIVTVNEDEKMIKHTTQEHIKKYKNTSQKNKKFNIMILDFLFYRIKLLAKITKIILTSKNINFYDRLKILIFSIHKCFIKCNGYLKEPNHP